MLIKNLAYEISIRYVNQLTIHFKTNWYNRDSIKVCKYVHEDIPVQKILIIYANFKNIYKKVNKIN